MLTNADNINEQSPVTVRVWTSEHNIRKKGMHHGKVSLELQGKEKYYISFLDTPQNEVGSNSNKEQKYSLSLDEDIKLLGRPPEYTFNFYTLDQTSIETKFKELKKTPTNIQSKDSATFIWKLLLAGQIENLISRTDKIVGHTKEALKGKANALKGKSVVVGKTIGLLGNIPFFPNPTFNLIKDGICVCANIIVKAAPEEIQKKPVERIVNGTVYSFHHIFQNYKTADNIVMPLQLAQVEEQRRMALIEDQKTLKLTA